jgi:hypothetical protein
MDPSNSCRTLIKRIAVVVAGSMGPVLAPGLWQGYLQHHASTKSSGRQEYLITSGTSQADEFNGSRPCPQEGELFMPLKIIRRDFAGLSAAAAASVWVRPVFGETHEAAEWVNPLIGASTSQKLGRAGQQGARAAVTTCLRRYLSMPAGRSRSRRSCEITGTVSLPDWKMNTRSTVLVRKEPCRE